MAENPDPEREGSPSAHDLIARLERHRGAASRYRIQGELARGGMGAILRIRDEDLGRELAMKVILGDEGSAAAPTDGAEPARASRPDARVLSRFLEEAQVTGQLDHPGIVPVHEIGVDERGRVYFTMRLVVGRDLEKIFELVRTREEGWSLTRAVGVLLKVCEATAYAHDKGVIHRDLKPANLMVGRFGEVYVMDWGLARVLGRADPHDLRPSAPRAEAPAPAQAQVQDSRVESRWHDSALRTMDGDIVGTPSYMSPEQARGDLQAMGPASDVYSVGAILYQLLAGHMPYSPPGPRKTAIEIWQGVRAGPPEPIEERAPQAPPELHAICRRAMARELERRYPSMQELANDLRAWLEGRVVSAHERGLLAELRKWVRRNRALAATLAGATVVLIGGLVAHAVVLSKKNSELQVANELTAASAKEARLQAKLAEERAQRILRLSDIKRLEQLETRAETLWPATPELVPRYVGWLDDARDVIGRLGGHEQALQEIRQRGTPVEGQAGAWNFEHTEERWQHDVQEELVRRLTLLADPARGLRADVERRLEFARTVDERTRSGPEAHARWTEACASIADPAACPLYAGLHLEPQLGLLPIGRDAHSGLWEFAHVQTGSAPQRDANSGELRLSEEGCLVFVLLPGGRFWMGAQKEQENEPNFDPLAAENESPPEELELAPFFLSKYEMTQGQWLRLTGKNPSIYGPDRTIGDHQGDLLHPVEQVSWNECSAVLAQLGLVLPTEAQWEYGARAGTDWPWWTGRERASLMGMVNLADRAAARLGATWPGIQDWPELDDGWAVHSPVNTFRANPFGLHDVAGNVWEWCRDCFGNYGAPRQDGDQELQVSDLRFRVSRGGSFFHSATQARSAARTNSAPDTRANHLGLRPARRVE